MEVTFNDLFGNNFILENGVVTLPKTELEKIGLDEYPNEDSAIACAIILNIYRSFNGYLLDADGSRIESLRYNLNSKYSDIQVKLRGSGVDEVNRHIIWEYEIDSVGELPEFNNDDSPFLTFDNDNYYIDTAKLHLPNSQAKTLLFSLLDKFSILPLENIKISRLDGYQIIKNNQINSLIIYVCRFNDVRTLNA